MSGRLSKSFLGGEERAKYGHIATVEDEDGERFSFHMPGRGSLGVIVLLCRAKGWRIVSLSTPITILRDLQGTREELEGPTWHTGNPSNRREFVRYPEESMLGPLKASDLFIRPS